MGLSLPCGRQGWRHDRFYLSATRNTKAAKRFLGKALKGLKAWQTPLKINTDKAPAYGPAITDLKKEGKLPEELVHRQESWIRVCIADANEKLW